MTLKQLAKKLIPPILVDGGRWIVKRARAEKAPLPVYELIPEGWARESHDPNVRGWNVDSVLVAYQQKWATFVESVQGNRILGLTPESKDQQPTHYTFDKNSVASHNVLISYAYVAALTAQGRTSLSLLDWGGGIGHYYLLTKAVLPQVTVEYHCKDLPKLVEHGRQLFPEAHFYTDDSCLQRQYDLVLVSASLQYSRDWQSDLARFAQAASRYLYVARILCCHDTPTSVVLQRAYSYGYNTEYLGWLFNYDEFRAAAQKLGLVLVREFLAHTGVRIAHVSEPANYYSFLFKRNSE